MAAMLAAGSIHADTRTDPRPWLDTRLGFEQRAADLVARMTLQEKVAQMQNSAPAIPRLGIPAYDWWNEALHGVARAGQATVFPQAIGMAATFDPALLHAEADAISDEARAKYNQFQRLDQHGRYEGLTFWSPNINIFRDPRWGRGQETYGEDPYLTARMGVAFVLGLQGDDPRYRKLDATAKHFAVHSGPESTRHEADVQPTGRDLYETYLPAFQALVQQGHVDAVMGAYNRVDGEPATASKRLLQDILRRDWGFKGYVVSDCDAVADIYTHHKVVATAAQASAMAVKHGDDLDCGTTYAALVDAVHQGLVSEADIDTAVTRLFAARMRLGMFDPPSMVPWSSLPYSVNQAPGHDALARRTADESLVLLKNTGLLPLSPDLRRIAVIGPTADSVSALVGNYNGTPAAPVTILAGIRAALPQAQVTYVKGSELVQGMGRPDGAELVASTYLRPSATSQEHGLTVEYFRNGDFSTTPVLSRVDDSINFHWGHATPTDDMVMQGELAADKALSGNGFGVRWSGLLLPPVSGRYTLDALAADGFRVYLDGKLVSDGGQAGDNVPAQQHVALDLKAGRPYDIRIEYTHDPRNGEVQLAWQLPHALPPFDEALAAARNAQVVIFVGGLTAELEGEQMQVDYPGFDGGDRTNLRLPATQQALLQALQATGKPVVLVLTGGSALAIDWAQAHVPAILLAWYPGQRGGTAVADALLGNTNPAGRLPVTFYKADTVLPAFDDYHMEGRTYRYFRGVPLYPFGFGLSYTHFTYSDLHLTRQRLGADESLTATVTVTNGGARDGDEVVQLYLRGLGTPHQRATRDLRGFTRIHLKAGASQQVRFTVTPSRDLRYYDAATHAYAVDAGQYELEVGASSADIRQQASFEVGR
ncbi:glycoside hydrolase family 3 protein [Rhodanobacter sp. DHB23]|uniref:glycoside hydrolase family 3 protein n=1 Tax=Rhodanobacter sp. DHB23 TaxID=2775923 RepID=UPI00177AD7C1|nr:glycoside hydrolase family 3 protein [Rhodanobacter sp. DHB23]MBD8871332.1 glycoside hydrolase family 3 C-terminal domain-containing protein [Rhodanobacter sp. DHB23]